MNKHSGRSTPAAKPSSTPALVCGLLVALIFGIALWLRAYLPYDKVFTEAGIKLAGNDSYYHMRLIENLLKHLFDPINFDPYTYFPHGTDVTWPPFFDWLVAVVIWVVGLGSPSQKLIDTIGVFYPAVLGALTVIPVYFIGKELFNRWAGVMAAALIAILPSQFLTRSLLGTVDHHVAETLFTTLVILFLILAIKSARKNPFGFSHLLRRDWPSIKKPLVYSLIAGIFLGVYLLSWVGGLLFVFLLFIYFIIQFMINHLRGTGLDDLSVIGMVTFLTAAIISLPILSGMDAGKQSAPAFAIALATLLALNLLSRFLRKNGVAPFFYPLTVAVLGIVLVAGVYLVDASFIPSMLRKLDFLSASGVVLTITEAQPLLFRNGSFSLSSAWNSFTTGFFLSFIAFGLLAYQTIRKADPGKTLLLVWSLFMFLATLGQNRFGYYYSVNVALLCGYLSWQVLSLGGFTDADELRARAEALKNDIKAKIKKPSGRKGSSFSRILIHSLAVVIVFFAVFYPNIEPAYSMGQLAPLVMKDAYYEALYWMRDNTPDPFGDPSFYYAEYQAPADGEDYNYPKSAYGVMTLWDYGHAITRIAHRIPVSNPFQQGASISDRFFVSQSATAANAIMDDLGAKYVFLDYPTALTYFRSVATFAGKDVTDYYETYYRMVDGKLTEMPIFYPKYYYSAVVRLYNFNGQAVTTTRSLVIAYKDKINADGESYKEITNALYFTNYEAAQAYVALQKSDNYLICSDNPFISPVPLEQMSQYSLIYKSNTITSWGDTKNLPWIKIFEYTG